MAVVEPLRFTAWEACDHPDPVVRFRTRANRTQVYVLQCLSCGRELKTLAKTSPEVLRQAERIPFDEALAQQKDEEQRANRESYWQQQRAQMQAETEKQQQEWWDWYNRYLESPRWKAKRALVMKRAGGMCEGCLIRPATQVHHTTYKHAGDELLFELVAICADCHRRIHPEMD